ncbi:MAG: LacI family DNA-binding transcriptional regulator [Pseudomonadota bacterium]
MAKSRTGTTKRAALSDVAAEAGVSVMTVSNVINNKEIVRSQTRERVIKAINKLGYVPTQAGRSLRTNKQWAVGFLLIDDNARYFNDPLNAEIIAGLSDRLNRAGFSLVVELGKSHSLQKINGFHRRLVDALVILSSGDAANIAKLEKATANLDVPRVFIQAAPVSKSVSTINLSDYESAMLIADHLAARGVTSALVIDTKLQWHAFSERKRGLKKGFAAISKEIQMSTIKSTSEGYEDTREALELYLDKNPTPDAVVGLNDYMAIAAMQCLQERGLRIPQDIKITGFNSAELINYVTPRLTTVHGSPFDVGAAAAEAAINPEQKIVNHRLPVALVRGDTT